MLTLSEFDSLVECSVLVFYFIPTLTIKAYTTVVLDLSRFSPFRQRVSKALAYLQVSFAPSRIDLQRLELLILRTIASHPNLRHYRYTFRKII